jgi:hypothetical protein
MFTAQIDPSAPVIYVSKTMILLKGSPDSVHDLARTFQPFYRLSSKPRVALRPLQVASLPCRLRILETMATFLRILPSHYVLVRTRGWGRFTGDSRPFSAGSTAMPRGGEHNGGARRRLARVVDHGP